jgi:hypothetical protein
MGDMASLKRAVGGVENWNFIQDQFDLRRYNNAVDFL